MTGLLVLDWLPATLDVARTEGAAVFAARCPPAAATVVVVPFPLIGWAARAAAGSGYAVGAPDVAPWREGAYTGEVSARMAADAGATYALINRRRLPRGERRDLLAERVRRALEAGLVPVLCLGEDAQAAEAQRGRADLLAARREALGPLPAADRRRVRLVYQSSAGAATDADPLLAGAETLAAADVEARPGVAAPARARRDALAAWRCGDLGTVLVDGPALAPLVEGLRATT